MGRNLGKAVKGGKIGAVSVLLPLCLVAVAPSSGAAEGSPWSGDGHRVVCHLAWNRLTPEARSSVRALLGGDMEAEAFSEGCVWADEIRSRLRPGADSLARFRPFTTAHYVNFPEGAKHLGRGGCTEHAPGRLRYCAIDAIDYLTHVVRGGASELSRAEALLFLIHIVGDLHQPLHAGYGHDRGGNDRVVNVMGTSDRNLHWVWDVFMVDHGDEPWEELAARLDEAVPASSEPRWRVPDPMIWAAESYEIVERQVYRDIEDGGYVGQDYYTRNVHTAELRLQMAGVRLAALLNRVFDPAS